MSDEQERHSRLKPTLGLLDATSISVGAIVGAGIFVVTGMAAGYAGSAFIISMLIAALICLFTALSFSDLTAWLPREGSVYEFGRELLTPFAGFVTGWMWMLSNTFAGAAVSLGFASYFANFFPTLSPAYIAAFVCLTFTALNFFGIRQSALFNNFLVITKLAILAFFCVFGLFHMNATNFVPFSPFNAGVFQGAFYIFFAYGGFGRVAVVAEEVKDARRIVPRAIILSLFISTIFYIAVGAIAIGLVGAPQLSISDSPLTHAISVTKSQFAVQIVAVGGLLATASVLLTSILGVSRMAYAMARRSDLPQRLSQLHTKYGTPYYSVWISGILMMLLVLFIDLSSVIAVGTFAMLFYYASANVSALRLPKDKRLYHQLVPILGATTCVALLAVVLFISPAAWIIGLVGLAAGTIYYVIKQGLTSRNSVSK